jgi:hypothetical protein
MARGSSTISPAKLGGFASLAGSLLLLSGILWLYFAPGLPLGESTVLPSGVFRLAGPLGVALATASLLGLYFLIARVGGSTAMLWATFGAVIILLSLAGLAYIVASQPPFSSPTVDEAFTDPPLLFTVSSALVSWIRPLGILLFAFALVREDVLFGRALLLFLVCFLEAPLVSNAVLYFAGPSLSVEWPILLFGLPGVQTGVIGALAWAAFGVSMLLLDRE